MNTTEVVSSSGAFKLEGATLEPVNNSLKDKLNIGSGLQIKKLNDGKWKDSDIKEGFIITRIDKREIKSAEDLSAALGNSRGEGKLIEGIYPNGEKAYYGVGW